MLEETSRVPNGAVNFDTQRVVDRLREGGWNEGQARALCDVLREIMRGVAKTSDLERVEASLRADLRADMQALESSLRADMQALESSLRSDVRAVQANMQSLEGQMASLRLIMLAGFGFLGILIALGNFL